MGLLLRVYGVATAAAATAAAAAAAASFRLFDFSTFRLFDFSDFLPVYVYFSTFRLRV